jgi:hypothetical protein
MIIESQIMKIASLLVIGFGEAGTRIISEKISTVGIDEIFTDME